MVQSKSVKNLDYYLKRFGHLRQAPTKYGPAPHKAVLLLSIIRGLEMGFLAENRIFVTPFQVSLFKTTWISLVDSGHISSFSLPFFHMQSEGFWHLKPQEGFELYLERTKSVTSFKQLQLSIQYAYLDGELFLLLAQGRNRNILKQMLMERYFPEKNWERNILSRKTYLDKISEDIVRKSPERYVAGVEALERVLDEKNLEEDHYIRKAAFRKQILRIYNNTCCVSGLRIEAMNDLALIDACHIVPFAVSHDDTIMNGLALSPTFHRAFDRHLIALDDEYRLLVSKSFVERCDSPHSIKQFEGRHILLPPKSRYYPSLAKLRAHRALCGL